MARQAGRRSAPRPTLRHRLANAFGRGRPIDPTTWFTVGLVALLACAGTVVLVTQVVGTSRGEDDLVADVARADTRPAAQTPSPTSKPRGKYPPLPAATIRPLSAQEKLAALRAQRRATMKVLNQDMAAKGLVPVPEAVTQPTTFTVSSFNVLGAGHTTGRGARGGFANGVTRMHAAASMISSNGVSVVGLQEFQSPQYQTFQALLGGSYDVWPGLALGQTPVQNSIAWRTSDWTMIGNGTTPIPYFGGTPVAMPHVLLHNVHTGQNVWFANYHNPADAHGPAQHWREAATAMEVNLVKQLTADGTPMVITGDMNERDGYACRLAGGAPTMHSADGARYDGGCSLPSRMNVDWIFGSDDIEFTTSTPTSRPRPATSPITRWCARPRPWLRPPTPPVASRPRRPTSGSARPRRP